MKNIRMNLVLLAFTTLCTCAFTANSKAAPPPDRPDDASIISALCSFDKTDMNAGTCLQPYGSKGIFGAICTVHVMPEPLVRVGPESIVGHFVGKTGDSLYVVPIETLGSSQPCDQNAAIALVENNGDGYRLVGYFTGVDKDLVRCTSVKQRGNQQLFCKSVSGNRRHYVKVDADKLYKNAEDVMSGGVGARGDATPVPAGSPLEAQLQTLMP